MCTRGSTSERESYLQTTERHCALQNSPSHSACSMEGLSHSARLHFIVEEEDVVVVPLVDDYTAESERSQSCGNGGCDAESFLARNENACRRVITEVDASD